MNNESLHSRCYLLEERNFIWHPIFIDVASNNSKNINSKYGSKKRKNRKLDEEEKLLVRYVKKAHFIWKEVEEYG